MDETTLLLLAAREGDRAALDAFVRRTQADVWRYLAHLVDRAAADDLTQETYVRVMAAAARFRGDASARTWLLSIARRVAADEIRSRRRRRLREDPRAAVEERAVDDQSADALLADELTALVDELPTDRRAAFVLTQLLGLSYAEAAAAEGVAVGTIRSRVARAREQLAPRARGRASDTGS